MILTRHNRPTPDKTPPELSTKTFQQFREIVYEHSGIVLADNKRPLVKGRIARRMRTMGIDDYEHYIKFVLEDSSNRELQELLDAISTNVTSFYREAHHFDFMRKLIADRLQLGVRKLRVWSAACSTGEEPYTIAIEILEAAGNTSIDAKILATDISTEVIEKCQKGIYSSSVVQPVPPLLRKKYFEAPDKHSNGTLQVTDKLRKMLSVRRFNLTSFPYSVAGPIDLIFCRNVMIYFDRPTRTKIIGEFERIVAPGGYIFVGHSESLSGMTNHSTCVRPSIYRRN